MTIEVIGMICRTCTEAERNVRDAVRKLELEAEIIRTDDAGKLNQYRVRHVPAVVIDGILKSFGGVRSERGIRDWLLPYMSSSITFDG